MKDKKNNTGLENSGDYNSGNYNSGYYNSGNRNSGNRNSGYRNSGDYNSGEYNSGDYNSGNYNSGAFNRDEPKMRLFEKEIDMTVSEFYEKYDIYMGIPLNNWINKEDMTEKEKEEVEGWETMGGYLKTLDFKEACKIWWKENPKDHDRFLSLPNFSWEIFTEITGIEKGTEDKKVTIKISESSLKALKESGIEIIN